MNKKDVDFSQAKQINENTLHLGCVCERERESLGIRNGKEMNGIVTLARPAFCMASMMAYVHCMPSQIHMYIYIYIYT